MTTESRDPTVGPNGEERCPECGMMLSTGYGLAGGGIGSYTYCPNTDCPNPYFDKAQDSPEDP